MSCNVADLGILGMEASKGWGGSSSIGRGLGGDDDSRQQRGPVGRAGDVENSMVGNVPGPYREEGREWEDNRIEGRLALENHSPATGAQRPVRWVAARRRCCASHLGWT